MTKKFQRGNVEHGVVTASTISAALMLGDCRIASGVHDRAMFDIDALWQPVEPGEDTIREIGWVHARKRWLGHQPNPRRLLQCRCKPGSPL
jgi:hypothetical protein